MTTSPARAALYLRVSLDATGEMLAVERQREDCQKIVAARGWQAVGEYVDNSISASDARKNRPGYDALVRAFEARDFDALVCYDLDRLTRQPRQLEDWIDRATEHQLVLVTANGEADLSTDAGRMFARIKSTVARAEVERKSARQTRAARQRSEKGKPPLGVRLTGYTTSGGVVEVEAAIIRRLFHLFVAGESLRSLAALMQNENVPTRHGGTWNPSSVRTILTNPRYAGRAVYQGCETGRRGGWEALVSDDMWALVQARLTDPRRTSNRFGTDRKHLGSGIFRCGGCGQRMRSFSGSRYRCAAGCFARSREPIDNLVLAIVRARLARPDIRRLITPTEDIAAPLVTEATALRDRLDRIGADYDEGLIDGPRYATATDKVTVDLRAIEKRIASLTVGSAVADTLTAADPVAAFDRLTLMSRRSVIDALCAVTLRPVVQGRRGFDPETVGIEWRQS